MDTTQNACNPEEIRVEINLLTKFWDMLSTDHRTEVIVTLRDDILGEHVVVEWFEADEFPTFDADVVCNTFKEKPTDPALNAVFDALEVLNVSNDKAAYVEVPRAPGCNKTLMQLYNDLSPSNKEHVHEHLGTSDVDAATENSLVIQYVLGNFIVRNGLV